MEKNNSFNVAKAKILIGQSATDMVKIYLDKELTSTFPETRNIDTPFFKVEVESDHGINWVMENFPDAIISFCDLRSEKPEWQILNKQTYLRVFRK